MRWSPWLPTILAASVVWSSSVSPQPTAGTATTGTVVHVNQETEKCLRAASNNKQPGISITIGKVSRAGKFVKVALSIENLTKSPIWMNIRPFTLQCSIPKEQQLFVTIRAPQIQIGHSETCDGVESPRADDYSVIKPHEKYQVKAIVEGEALDLRPGSYRVDACFWDRTSTIPKPPKWAMTIRGPVAASDVVVVAP